MYPTPVFLIRGGLPGPIIDAHAAGAVFAFQAHFDGLVVFTLWRRADVEALLPAGLVPATDPTGFELHPVVFIFGEQHRGETLFGGRALPTGGDYHECGIFIPYVKHVAGRYLHCYAQRMYASYHPVVWTGNAHWGLAKKQATMWWHEALYVVMDTTGRALIEAMAEPDSDWQPADRCTLANFAAVRALGVLPVLGRRPDRTYVTSYFDWDFTHAQARPARAHVTILAPLGGGLLPRECPSAPGGALEVRGMRWKLSWSGPCRF